MLGLESEYFYHMILFLDDDNVIISLCYKLYFRIFSMSWKAKRRILLLWGTRFLSKMTKVPWLMVGKNVPLDLDGKAQCLTERNLSVDQHQIQACKEKITAPNPMGKIVVVDIILQRSKICPKKCNFRESDHIAWFFSFFKKNLTWLLSFLLHYFSDFRAQCICGLKAFTWQQESRTKVSNLFTCFTITQCF